MSLRTNLVSYYELNETSGTTATDSEGSNDGTYNGDLPTAVSGIQGNAQDFDGTGDYIALPSGLTRLSGDYTIGGWINIDTTVDTMYITSDWSFSERNYLFYINSSAQLVLENGDGGGNQDSGIQSSALNTGQWYFVVAQREGSTFRIFVDGEQVASRNGSYSGGTTSNDRNLFENFSASGNEFDGKGDEFFFYNASISSLKLKELYNNGIGRDYATTEFDGTNWDGYDDVVSDNTKVNAVGNYSYNVIDMKNLSSGFWNSVASDGSDVRVTNSAGDLAYPAKVVNIDTGTNTGALYFWGQNLETGSDVTYRVYAGNTGASEPAEGDPLGKHAVLHPDWELYYPFSETSGNAIDLTRNSHDGTYNGDLPTAITGGIDDGQDFDGTGDYVTVPAAAENSLGKDFSVIAIANSDVTINADNFEILRYRETYNIGLGHIDSELSSGEFGMWVFDGTNYDYAVGTGFSSGTQYHFGGVTDDGSSNVLFYADGSLQQTTAVSNYDTGYTDGISVGAFPTGVNEWNGLIDEFKIWNNRNEILPTGFFSTDNNMTTDNTNFWSVTSNFQQAFTVTLTETLSLTDTLERDTSFNKTIEETLSLTDQQERLTNYSKSFSDTLTLSDTVAAARFMAIVLSDTLNLSDNVQFQFGSIVELTDTINLSDDIEKMISIELSDTINISDNMERQTKFAKTLIETISLADKLIFKGWSWIKKNVNTNWSFRNKNTNVNWTFKDKNNN